MDKYVTRVCGEQKFINDQLNKGLIIDWTRPIRTIKHHYPAKVLRIKKNEPYYSHLVEVVMPNLKAIGWYNVDGVYAGMHDLDKDYCLNLENSQDKRSAMQKFKNFLMFEK